MDKQIKNTDHQKNIPKVTNSRVFGATMLIAGCCIGAGMLGLPVLTAFGGFAPTIVLFVFAWAFMAATGLLLLEVNLMFKNEVSIISMTRQTLGPIGSFLGWVLFAFLFYSLMIAYVSGSGQIIADLSRGILGVIIPDWVGGMLLTLMFGSFIYYGTRLIDRFNRILMIGIVVSYFALIYIGSQYVNPELLKHVDWKAAVPAVPAMIISFGYHNLIPSLTTYLQHDRNKLRFAILVGSFIPLLVYLLWESIMLGLVPLVGENGYEGALDRGEIATRVLRNLVGAGWVITVADVFAFFAIITSLLGVSLSFADFLADGLQVKKTHLGKILLAVMSLGPPWVLSLIYPTIFLSALSYAGAFGAVVLFGIMPAVMVWSARYGNSGFNQNLVKEILPGEKFGLIIIIIISLLIMGLEIQHQLV